MGEELLGHWFFSFPVRIASPAGLRLNYGYDPTEKLNLAASPAYPAALHLPPSAVVMSPGGGWSSVKGIAGDQRLPLASGAPPVTLLQSSTRSATIFFACIFFRLNVNTTECCTRKASHDSVSV